MGQLFIGAPVFSMNYWWRLWG